MNVKKQLILFLIICLPATWALTAIPISIAGDEYNKSAVVYVLSTLAAFMPAITALICKLVSKESIRTLNFLPKFIGNAKTYLLAIVGGLAISIWDAPLIMCLFMKNGAALHQDATVLIIIFNLLLCAAVACIQFYVLVGEEIGWMGFLFPKLEEIFGTNVSVVLTGVVRGIWHAGMLCNNENFAKMVLELCITNIIFGVFLVLLTKRSKSVIPAAICHALNNVIPNVMSSLIIIDKTVYADNKLLINSIIFVPQLIFMIICWYMLNKMHSHKKGRKVAEIGLKS